MKHISVIFSSMSDSVFGKGSQLQLAYSSTGQMSCLCALARREVDLGGMVRLINTRVLDALAAVKSM